MKKVFKILFLALLLISILLTICYYETGQDVELLKAEYTYSDSQFIKVDGMDVHYRKTGKGHPLILIHGVASSLHTWEGWQDILDDHFQVISFDVPSFGLTGPHPDNDYSVNMYMNFMDSLLDQLGIDSCHIAGNSFGGFLGWNYASHNSNRLKKLILLDAAGIATSEDRSKNIGFWLTSHPITKKITHRITPRFMVTQGVEDVYGDPSIIEEKTFELYYDMLTREGNREAFSEVLNMVINETDVNDRIKAIQQPTLILWGDKDVLIPVDDAYTFDQLIPDSEVKIYKGIGHIPMEEIPERSAQDALEFLISPL